MPCNVVGGKGHAYRRDLWHMLNSSGHDFTFVGTEIRVLKTLFPKPTFGVHKSDFEMWHESWAGVSSSLIEEGTLTGM